MAERRDETAGEDPPPAPTEHEPARRLPPLRAPGAELSKPPVPDTSPEGPDTIPATLPALRRPEEKPAVQPPDLPPQGDKDQAIDALEERGEGRPLRAAGWIVVSLAALAAIVAAVVAGASGSHGGTFLSISFGPDGDTGVYRNERIMRGFIQSSSGQQSPFELSATEMESFRVERSSGSSTQLSVGSNEWGFFNGQPLQQRLSVDTPIVIGANGQIAGGGKIPLPGQAGHAGAMPGTDLFVPALPDRPVSSGDTWSDDYRRPFAIPGGGSIEYETTNKLVRFDSVQGNRAAVISTDARVPIDVTLAIPQVRALNPSLAKEIANAFDLTPRSRFEYRGLVTYRLTSTVDTVTHRLMKSRVTGQVRVRVTASGVSTPETFQIVSSLTQSGRLVS
jgi:hypothetical protein